MAEITSRKLLNFEILRLHEALFELNYDVSSQQQKRQSYVFDDAGETDWKITKNFMVLQPHLDAINMEKQKILDRYLNAAETARASSAPGAPEEPAQVTEQLLPPGSICELQFQRDNSALSQKESDLDLTSLARIDYKDLKTKKNKIPGAMVARLILILDGFEKEDAA